MQVAVCEIFKAGREIETEELRRGHREIGEPVGADCQALQLAELLLERTLNRDTGLALVEQDGLVLGFGLIHSQKAMAVARATPERKLAASLS